MGTEVFLPPQGEFQSTAMAGYRRLAAALIYDAIRAYEKYWDPRSVKYRELVRNEKEPGNGFTWQQWERYGLQKNRVTYEWCSRYSLGADPGRFLLHATVWHDLIGIDVGKMKTLLAGDKFELRKKCDDLQRLFLSKKGRKRKKG